LGLHWDGPIIMQSARASRHAEVIDALDARGLLFSCDCSRAQLAAAASTAALSPDAAVLNAAGIDPPEPCCVGQCRSRQLARRNTSLRLDLRACAARTNIDRSLGPIAFDPERHRDVVLRRRDGLATYHLAMTADDHDAAVTDVVRGADLCPATAWQMGLRSALGWPEPRLLHVPVVCDAGGRKLSKSLSAAAIAMLAPIDALRSTLALLAQAPPPAERVASAAALLEWAVGAWEPQRFRTVRAVQESSEIRAE
jgi:glutamyl-Q tRNA(Asp) synthetase